MSAPSEKQSGQNGAGGGTAGTRAPFAPPDDVRRRFLWLGLALAAALAVLFLVPYGSPAYLLATMAAVVVGLVVYRLVARHAYPDMSPRAAAILWWLTVAIGIVGVGWAAWQTIT